jgi:transposase
MIEALIAGERDPRRLADLARGKMRPKRSALVDALTGRFDEHHGELARMLLNQIDALGTQIGTLTARIDELLADLTSTVPVDAILDGGSAPVVTGLDAAKRLAEITGIGPVSAQVVVAEIGLDMSRFPTAAHLVSWAKLSPRTIQSGATQRGGKTGKGNPYLKGALGEAAAVAARTDTFLGERYRGIVERRGKLKALVAVARSILVIVWNLLARPGARYQDLGSDYHVRRVDTERRVRSHLTQLASLGYRVTVEPAA